jgi:AcrR family transcriptional regulator
MAARRTGRRPGEATTHEAILRAASREFADRGYDGATIRGIAARARVDPALVHHYFGTKEHLFATAMRLPMRPSEIVPLVLAGPRRELGERMARMFFAIWEPRGPDPSPVVGLVRSASTNEAAARMLREFIGREVLGRVVSALDVDRPELRTALAGAQLLGVGMLRYVVRLPTLADRDPEDLVRALAPTQRYLTGSLP